MKIEIEFTTTVELAEQLAQLGFFASAPTTATETPAEVVEDAPAPTKPKRTRKKAAAPVEEEEIIDPEVIDPEVIDPEVIDPEQASAQGEDPAGDDADTLELTRTLFEEVVGEDYDVALGMLTQLDCDTWTDVVTQNRVTDLRMLMEAGAS